MKVISYQPVYGSVERSDLKGFNKIHVMINKKFRTIAQLRIYSHNNSTVARLFLTGPEPHQGYGEGHEYGIGYDRSIPAIYRAFDNAGIRFNDHPGSKPEQALKALAEKMGEDATYFVFFP